MAVVVDPVRLDPSSPRRRKAQRTAVRNRRDRAWQHPDTRRIMPDFGAKPRSFCINHANLAELARLCPLVPAQAGTQRSITIPIPAFAGMSGGWGFHSDAKPRYFARQEPARPSLMTMPLVAPFVAKASGWLSDAANLADLAQGSTVYLAVTGLSRSGKTVFITSLIHNLLSAVHNPNRMPLLGVVGERPPDRRAARKPRRRPAAALPLSGEHRDDGGGRAGLAGAHRRPARDRHRRALHAGERAGQASQRDQRQPGDDHDPDRRLSRRVAARPAAAGAKLRRVVARDAAALSPRRARRGGVRFPRLHRAAPPRRGRERGDREAGARSLSRVPVQGARHARPELPAAGPLPVSGQSRRRAVPLVRAARRCRQRRLRAEHARRADGGAFRGLQARGGRALLRGSLPLVLAADRAGRRAARAARRPRGVRGPAARARSDPAKLPLRLRRHRSRN